MNNSKIISPIFTDEKTEGKLVRIRPKRTKKIAFGWYGGKFSHLDWLLPLLPESHHYCEPFAGSGAVLLNRKPSPVETYNDMDGEVVNFFKTLRDNGAELERLIALTPFSREELYIAVNGNYSGITDVERGRRFYVRARQTRTGLAQTSSVGRWANCKDTSRGGMSGAVSRWLGGIDQLEDIAKRLLRVQIENRPAIDVIKLYDSDKTLFYCDPPYVHSTRGDSKAYKFEMTDEQHVELFNTLNNIKGKAAISGYRCKLMDALYKNWNRFDAPVKTTHTTKEKRQETLWMNF